jgi:hypothetical protein
MNDLPTGFGGATGAILRLHARYDGAIPKSLRAAANAGGAERRARLQVEARRLMFDALARDALRALAARRLRLANCGLGVDRDLGALARDLRFYRDRGVARSGG